MFALCNEETVYMKLNAKTNASFHILLMPDKTLGMHPVQGSIIIPGSMVNFASDIILIKF